MLIVLCVQQRWWWVVAVVLLPSAPDADSRNVTWVFLDYFTSLHTLAVLKSITLWKAPHVAHTHRHWAKAKKPKVIISVLIDINIPLLKGNRSLHYVYFKQEEPTHYVKCSSLYLQYLSQCIIERLLTERSGWLYLSPGSSRVNFIAGAFTKQLNVEAINWMIYRSPKVWVEGTG